MRVEDPSTFTYPPNNVAGVIFHTHLTGDQLRTWHQANGLKEPGNLNLAGLPGHRILKGQRL